MNKERAKENVDGLLAMLQYISALQELAVDYGHEPMEGCEQCYYEPWLSSIYFYFGEIRLRDFLTSMVWQEWLDICFMDFYRTSIEEHRNFSMSFVKLSMNKMKALRDLLPRYAFSR